MELYDRRNAPKRAHTWFVYALVDSRFPTEVRYVGITNDPRRRLSHHHSTVLDNSTRKARWIAKVIRTGGQILMAIISRDLAIDVAKTIECEKISTLPNLTNLTLGGDGSVGREVSLVSRARMAAARRGKPLSRETKQKLRELNIGRTSPNKGRVLSDEWRENISRGGRLRMKDPDIRAEISRVGRLRYESAEERERTAIATRLAGPPKNNASGFKGVSFNSRTKKWIAQIKAPKRRGLGYFLSPEDAARAYDKAAFAAWGDDCYLNFSAEMTA